MSISSEIKQDQIISSVINVWSQDFTTQKCLFIMVLLLQILLC